MVSLALGGTITSLRILGMQRNSRCHNYGVSLTAHEALTGVSEPNCVSDFMALMGSLLQYVYKASYVVILQR